LFGLEFNLDSSSTARTELSSSPTASQSPTSEGSEDIGQQAVNKLSLFGVEIDLDSLRETLTEISQRSEDVPTTVAQIPSSVGHLLEQLSTVVENMQTVTENGTSDLDGDNMTRESMVSKGEETSKLKHLLNALKSFINDLVAARNEDASTEFGSTISTEDPSADSIQLTNRADVTVEVDWQTPMKKIHLKRDYNETLAAARNISIDDRSIEITHTLQYAN